MPGCPDGPAAAAGWGRKGPEKNFSKHVSWIGGVAVLHPTTHTDTARDANEAESGFALPEGSGGDQPEGRTT